MAMTESYEVTAGMSMPAAGLVPRAGADQPADLVVRNARVFTGDPRRPAASAVAIGGGRILKVSDDHGVARHITASTRVVDAVGRRVSRAPASGRQREFVWIVGRHFIVIARGSSEEGG